MYSCNYGHYRTIEDENASKYSELNGIYFGYKYQCVELARRWLVFNKGYSFQSVHVASQIFKLRSVSLVDTSLLPLKMTEQTTVEDTHKDVGKFQRVRTTQTVGMRAVSNGSKERPVAGSMMIWKGNWRKGDFTGHVAIITRVSNDHVCIVEQNIEDMVNFLSSKGPRQ